MNYGNNIYLKNTEKLLKNNKYILLVFLTLFTTYFNGLNDYG